MILNLSSVNMTTIIDELLQKKGKISVIFDNGETVEMGVRRLIFHMIFWVIAKRWGAPITPDMIVETPSVNSSTISDIGTRILNAVRKIHPIYHDIVYDFNDAVNRLNNFVIDHCQEYHKSLSILDLARIAVIPEIQAITQNKIANPEVPMREANKQINDNIKILHEELKKPYKNNNIRDFINLRFVKDVQLAHIFHQIGYRTDIDDSVIRYPVQGNYLDGLQNTTEYCLETLSAKKSAFYNKDSLPTTEYFGRKQHILLSSIKHLYPGDCGTNVTMPLMITEKMRNVVLHKNIVVGSQLVTLTEDNIDQYVNTIVEFRTPMACRHRDGVCEACGGKLLGSITPNTHIGIFSAIQTTSVVTQTILSAKHMQSTRTVDYVIPADLANILMKTKGNIFAKPKLVEKMKETSLVFHVDDTRHLMGLSNFRLNHVDSINESAFGVCRDIVIIKENAPMTDKVSLYVNGQSPLYSKYLIKYIGEHPDYVSIRDDMFILNMADFDFRYPLFKLIIMNDSMVKFVDSAKKLLENRIQSYTSAVELVNDFTNLVYSQVKPNIVYLEVVLRAAMITSKFDYRLPTVTDINNVTFTTNHNANMMRSMGMLCAFQELPSAFEDPTTYLVPRTYTAFDDFLNLKSKYRE